MTRTVEILCVYLTGLFQGLVLVTVPAASLVFTDPHKFGFSNAEYGFIFVPQVMTAIAASLLGPVFARKWGMKSVYLAGLFFNIQAMVLIAASQLLLEDRHAAYMLVILGTAFVGAGFGTVLPIINVYATYFFSKNPASALTVLHTLLGTGTALAPFLVAIFVKQTGWWLLPFGVMAALMILLAGAFVLPLKDKPAMAATGRLPVETGAFLPLKVLLFMLTVFLYGYCETFFANWATIFLNKEKGIRLQEAGYALAAFWMAVSAGRLLISLLSVWVPPRWIYKVLPVLIAVSLAAVTRASSPANGILLFSAAGLSCSAFFPLTFSLGQKGFEPIAERISGWLMASYMVGYGAAAYGIGKIIEVTHASLGTCYLDSTIAAVGVVFLSWVLA